MLTMGLAGTGTALGADVVMLLLGAATNPLGWAVMAGGCATATVAVGGACIASAVRFDAVSSAGLTCT